MKYALLLVAAGTALGQETSESSSQATLEPPVAAPSNPAEAVTHTDSSGPGLAGSEATPAPEAETRDSSLRQLPDVVVRGKRQSSEAAAAGFSTATVDVARSRDRAVDVQDLVARASGVVVREEGGLGSGAEISLSGLSGRHVRVFLDGVPIEQLGVGSDLGSLPPNAVQSIEIYKGVVPVGLGADALGGAVDVRTATGGDPFLDASVSVASFGTRRASANGLWVIPRTPLRLRANAVFNHSDNDYRIRWHLLDSLGKPLPDRDFRRFHDAYTSWWANAEIGVEGQAWADQAWLGGTFGSVDDDVQNALSLERVYGAVEQGSESWLLLGRWRLAPARGLSLSAYASSGRTVHDVVDTSSYKYDWSGDSVLRANTAIGEALWYKTLFRIREDALTGSASARWDFLRTWTLESNWVATDFRSETEDRLGVTTGVTPPSRISKSVAGLSLRGAFLADRLSATIFGKRYDQSAELAYFEGYGGAMEVEEASSETGSWGAGSAISWAPLPLLTARFSWEDALRLPDPSELLGDGLLARPNPDLGPEHSLNLNAGASLALRPGATRLRLDGGFFWRSVRDLIRIEADGPSSQSINEGKVRVAGLEGEVAWERPGTWETSVNATWQDLRNDDPESATYGDRLPNKPWLFGNARAAAHWRRPFGLGARLTGEWNTRFLQEYYRYWPSLGDPDTKFTIPTQWSHSIEVVAAPAGERLSVSLGCDNLLDARLYDNFRQQKPGRSFAAKLRVRL